MCCSAWLNRGTLAGLVLGLVVGGGATAAFFLLREKPKEQANAEPPKPEPVKPEPVKPDAVEFKLAEQKKTRAQLDCRALSQAIEAYMISPQNAGISDEERMPTSLRDLYAVPFGGPSFLRNGEADTIDPWGKPYSIARMSRQDGTVYTLVRTTAPDGTPISQFGIGENARPRN